VRDVSTRREKKSLFLARATSLSLSLDQNVFLFFFFFSSHAWNNEKVKSFENLKFLVVLYEQ